MYFGLEVTGSETVQRIFTLQCYEFRLGEFQSQQIASSHCQLFAKIVMQRQSIQRIANCDEYIVRLDFPFEAIHAKMGWVERVD